MPPASSLRPYLPALSILAAGMVFHAVSMRMLGRGVEATFFVYMLAMLVGAWRGYGPGLLVTGLVIVVLPFLFQPAFSVSRINLVGLACLTLMSLFVSRTAAAQKRAEGQLRQLNRDLESRVQEKIRDLEALVDREQAARAERDALLVREQAAHTAADQANRSKDEFLATVSHELRGPLQGIVGFAQLLQTGSLTRPQEEAALQAVLRNSRSLASLVDDIYDVSRIMTGKLVLELEPVNLSLVADAAIENVRATAERKGVSLSVDRPSDLGMISADGNRLQQAIWNVLSNAVKFTPRGGRVSMTIRGDVNDLRIDIADSGAGIDPEFLPFVFDRFRQADASITRSHGGLGLGLAIAQQIVEAHGGTVEAASDGPGRGATFSLRLPTGSEPSNRDGPSGAKSPDLRKPSLDGVTVLVLDDHGDSRDVLSLSLAQCGARVESAASVSAAMELIRRRRPDVLVSDLAMPGENGFNLLAKVRSLDGGADIPAIAVTGFASEADRERTLSAGFAAHFSKPVDLDRLAATVTELARRWSRVTRIR